MKVCFASRIFRLQPRKMRFPTFINRVELNFISCNSSCLDIYETSIVYDRVDDVHNQAATAAANN